jgi:hypothetical protein
MRSVVLFRFGIGGVYTERTAPAMRKGESELNRGWFKTSSLSRSDRLVRSHQLLRIEQLLGKNAGYAGTCALPKARR